MFCEGVGVADEMPEMLIFLNLLTELWKRRVQDRFCFMISAFPRERLGKKVQRPTDANAASMRTGNLTMMKFRG